MLVLSRNKGESIIVDNMIRVTVLGATENGVVRIGIEAPKEVPVDREEIYWKKEANRNE